ncbi:AAA family ATPase [Endozoicomonas ascidiicola]|uniref:AAA family ATPase n=1 Tax=Endozoicomonas ascidiicola TaxID=1698521 RepID=UPI000834C507|nr:AAA family ATPase [Endozoicomonas ascidiicola]
MTDFHFDKVPSIDEIDSVDLMNLSYEGRKPMDFILPGFLAGTVGSVIGAGGGSKSLLSQIISFNVGGVKSVDLDIGDIPVGRSVFISCEDPKIVTEDRALAIKEYCTQEEWEMVARNVDIKCFSEYSIDIMDDRWFKLFVEMLEGTRLAIIDTLSLIHSYDENVNTDMKKIISRFRQICEITGSGILFIHHANKGTVLSGNADSQQAARGASSITDNVRFQLNVFMPSNDDRDFKKVAGTLKNRDCVALLASKVNYGEKYGTFYYERISSDHPNNKGGYILKKLQKGASSEQKKYD